LASEVRAQQVRELGIAFTEKNPETSIPGNRVGVGDAVAFFHA
jgi:hypothetical protein